MPLQQDQERAERGGALSLTPVSVAIRLTRVETAQALLQGAAERIEAKLDRLLSALAEDEQDDEQGHDLEGNPLPPPRDPHEPL